MVSWKEVCLPIRLIVYLDERTLKGIHRILWETDLARGGIYLDFCVAFQLFWFNMPCEWMDCLPPTVVVGIAGTCLGDCK